jgi:hypothetical protein
VRGANVEIVTYHVLRLKTSVTLAHGLLTTGEFGTGFAVVYREGCTLGVPWVVAVELSICDVYQA